MGRERFAFEKFLFTLIVFLAGVSLLACFCQSAVAAQTSAFNLEGKPVDPFDSAGEKIVVLIFVRTDCPVSNRYAPEIQKLQAEHSGSATFWLVYPAPAESASMIRKHERDFGYTIRTLRDPWHALVKQSQVSITPEAAVFNASRRLMYHGRIDDLYQDISRTRRAPTTHDLNDAIRAAVAGRAVPASSAPAVGCYISDIE